MRGSPTRQSIARGAPQRRSPADAGASTWLPGTLDSNCDHWPYPDANNAGGMWRQCGARRDPKAVANTDEIAAFHRRDLRSKFAISSVDKAVTPRLYSPHNGAPPAFRRDDAPAKHLTHRGDQTVRFRSDVSGFGGSPVLRGEGIAWSPGCLTSESEERETWTAESLRAALASGEIVVRCGRTRLRRYTFLGTTLVGCVSNHADDYMLDLVNECGGAQASLRAKRVIARSKSQSNLRV